MKKHYTISLLAILATCLLSVSSLLAQRTVQLKSPKSLVKGNVLPEDCINCGLTGGAGDVGTIYYGSTPSGSENKPVLVFVHGYTSSASTWWDGNDMYSKAWAAGYRTAFVSVHPDKSLWENGEMFSGMLSTITRKYNVGKVVVVAHSKGGIDTDAALIHYGGWQYVDRAITLSSPHFGTALADLAQNGWVWWLSSVFGQRNDATEVLQTGFMNYYRSITDTHPNNSNVDFRTIGAWGYGGILTIPGWYLNANGGGKSTGGNDGVVAYYSSKRPGSAVLLGGHGDSRSNLDHFEVAEGQYVWDYVKNQIPSGALREVAFSDKKTAIDYNPLEQINSTSQILSADKGERSFYVEQGVKNIQLTISQFSETDEVSVVYPDGRRVKANKGTKGGVLSYERNINLSNATAGTYRVVSDAPYVAVVTMGEASLKATLDMGLKGSKRVFESGETINFEVGVSKNRQKLRGQAATGTITLVTNLEGKAVENGASHILKFAKDGLMLNAEMRNVLATGIYNLTIEVKSGKSTRSIVSSFAVVEGKGNGSRSTGSIEKDRAFEMGLPYPNPFSISTRIDFTTKTAGNFSLNVFDVTGKKVAQIEKKNLSSGTHSIEWDGKGNFDNGVYFLELTNGSEKEVKRVILNR